jgi:hypothetical protein
MNSAPVEGAERIRAEADPNREPKPELFGEAAASVPLSVLGVNQRRTP